MKEAMGSTWILGIVILFVVLFASFLAYSINYTKAFNTKNEIINLIERYEGYTISGEDMDSKSLDQLLDSTKVDDKAFGYIKSAGYNYTSSEKIDCTKAGHVKSEAKKGGYCVTKICTGSGNDIKTYYKVTTFITVDLPLAGVIANLKISGETQVLYEDVTLTRNADGTVNLESCDKVVSY